VNLPERTDRRDAMTLMATVTGIKLTFVDGVRGADVLEKALPPGERNKNIQSMGAIGSWRAHMNVLQRLICPVRHAMFNATMATVKFAEDMGNPLWRLTTGQHLGCVDHLKDRTGKHHERACTGRRPRLGRTHQNPTAEIRRSFAKVHAAPTRRCAYIPAEPIHTQSPAAGTGTPSSEYQRCPVDDTTKSLAVWRRLGRLMAGPHGRRASFRLPIIKSKR
jgi:hypothetical protein